MDEVLGNNYIYHMVYWDDEVYHKDHNGEDLEEEVNKDRREDEDLVAPDEDLVALDEDLVGLDEDLVGQDEDLVGLGDNKVLPVVEGNKDHKERVAKV